MQGGKRCKPASKDSGIRRQPQHNSILCAKAQLIIISDIWAV